MEIQDCQNYALQQLIQQQQQGKFSADILSITWILKCLWAFGQKKDVSSAHPLLLHPAAHRRSSARAYKELPIHVWRRGIQISQEATKQTEQA